MKLLVLAAAMALATPAIAENRTIELGFAGLMDHSNHIDLPPINLTAGKMLTEGPFALLAGVYYSLDIVSDGTQQLGIEGPGFFRNVWVKEIVIDDIEVRPLGVDSIDFDDEGTVSISFIAITPGQYDIRIRGTTGATQRVAVTIQ